MTLGQFFEYVTQNPYLVLFYFFALPFTSLLANWLGAGEGHLSPWKYLYTVLVYLACIPGIFALTLNVYMFLFERQPIMETNLFIQVLPVLCMLLTLWIIKRNVQLVDVPGFDKIGNLVFIITILISMMWIIEKTHLFVFTYMPFYQFILLFAGFLILIRWLWSRMVS
ncbi:MAG: hypothetical protein J5I52_01185 [Saprospiraceae bacterium]|nr:MAG: hypothetical protein UZ09_BCD002002163 [Bacteroidetes bacterium OLB9]MCO6462739.1 hypothetical protein [Saprospiraceae bacterium]MCZ2340134.1 hypothetical protein [Chitinophagales bacterium]